MEKRKETAISGLTDLLRSFYEEWDFQDLLEAKGLLEIYKEAIDSAQDPNELGLPQPGQETVAVYRLRDGEGNRFREVRVVGTDLERLEDRARSRMARSLGLPDPSTQDKEARVLTDQAGRRYRLVPEGSGKREKGAIGGRGRLIATAVAVGLAVLAAI